jgi:hypothetical protein
MKTLVKGHHPDESLCEKQDASSRVIKTPGHEQIVFPNPIVKNNNKLSCKRPKKNQETGFRNKRVGRLISRSLRNKSKAYVSSIESIEIHESSDSEIERFLAEEDQNCSEPTQPFDYVNNIPPCLKDNKGFTGIKLGQRLDSG